ncbi:MAG: hypothetical protein ACXVBE_15505, partial [Bdellovibrionota bacterium]
MALPLTAQCFTEQELQHKKDVLSEVSKIADEADSSLPPCIGLDRLSETALKQAPPKTCTLAFAFYSSLVQLDGVIRASCRKIAKFTEDTIQSPKYCKRDIKLSNKIKRQLVKFK